MRDLTHGLPPVLIYDQSWTNWVFSSTFWSRTAHGRKITSSGFVQGRPIIRKGSFYLRSETIGQSEDRTSCNLQSVILVRNPRDRPQRSQNTNMHRMLPKHEDNLILFYLQKLVFWKLRKHVNQYPALWERTDVDGCHLPSTHTAPPQPGLKTRRQGLCVFVTFFKNCNPLQTRSKWACTPIAVELSVGIITCQFLKLFDNLVHKVNTNIKPTRYLISFSFLLCSCVHLHLLAIQGC